MTRYRFGKTDLQVSPIGFGAAEIGFLKTDQERAAQVMNLLLDEGVNVIDTAANYETSEEIIGRAIGHRRNQFVLISKCGQKFPGLTGDAWSPEMVTQTVDRALSRLKTDFLDVMLLHTCDLEVLKKGEALGALLNAKKSGKVKFVGYSGDNDRAAYAAALPDVAVIETSINIADQANIHEVLPIAGKNNVGILTKRPIANAAWKKTSEQPGFYGSYAQPYVDRLQKMKLNPATLGFTGAPESAWPEMALRFTLSQPAVSTAIIGTTNPEHVRRNLQFAAKGPLPAEVIQKIRDAFSSARGGESWPGLQ